LKPAAETLTGEARELGIPFHLAANGLLLLGYGVNQVRLRLPDGSNRPGGTITGATTHLAAETADNRELTISMLREAKIPVPAGFRIRSEGELSAAMTQLATPFVIKPLTGNHGRGACITYRGPESVKDLAHNLNNYRELYAEEFCEGHLYRALMIDHRIEGLIVHRRIMTKGDGQKSLGELLAAAQLVTSLHDGYDLHFVPDKDQQVWIDGPAEEATFGIDEHARAVMCRASMHAGLPFCGIDFIVPENDTNPGNGLRIIATDPRPDLQLFLKPGKGPGVNVIKPLYRMLLGEKNMGRIPVIAVRGNGDSPEITKLLAHICVHAGRRAGSASLGGMTMGGYTISHQDCAGGVNVRGLLFDPTTDTAIVECPTREILESGLPFDTSDISIITGSGTAEKKRRSEAYDHELRADLVAGRTTLRSGYNILNADNGCDGLEEDLYGKTALYSMRSSHPNVERHCQNGGVAATIDNEGIVLFEGRWRTPLLRAGNAHRTDQGFLKAALPAALAAWALNIAPGIIADALASYQDAAAGASSRKQGHMVLESI
jgi:cyanophycin synthetase